MSVHTGANQEEQASTDWFCPLDSHTTSVYSDESGGSSSALDVTLIGASLLGDEEESDLEALTGASLATGEGKSLLSCSLW